MNYEDLLLEKEDGVAIITLNNPAKLNALSEGMRKSLLLAADEIAKDDEVRVVIVTGAGRGFCSGADVGAQAARAHGETPVKSRQKLMQVAGWPNAEIFPKLNKPVIAAINGPAAGAGFSIAMSCDIRIASETARFGLAFILRALVPDTGMTYWLPEAIGRSKALELMFTGEMIDAAEAERLGIVSRVVPPDELMKVARELATKIAKQAPIALELTKRVVNRAMLDDLAYQLDLEDRAQRMCHLTEDHKEAAQAFLEKRTPQFKGS